jgi:hypothetical protein
MVCPCQKIGAKKERSLDILFDRQQQTLAWSHVINEAMCERPVSPKRQTQDEYGYTIRFENKPDRCSRLDRRKKITGR